MQVLSVIRHAFQSFLGVTIRKSTLVFLVPGILLLIGGLSLGSNGVILDYLGAVVMVAGYVISLRKPRHFLFLAIASLACFPVGVFLHNAFYAMNELWGHILVLHWAFEFLHAAFFVLAVVISPAGVLIGIAGWAAMLAYRYARNAG